ncbi:MAG: hypothetical protein C4332_13860 [Meiothermus sp.]
MGNEGITVHSGNSTILRHGEAMCRAQQLPKQVHLVLDAPYGFALHRLAGIPCPVVVVTGVSSPSYLITLWELRPNSLIARPAAPHDVLYACESVAKGNRFYEGPPLVVPVLLRTGEVWQPEIGTALPESELSAVAHHLNNLGAASLPMA